MYDELVKVIPSFLKRVDVPERGVAWSTYMSETKSATRDLVESMWPPIDEDEPTEQVRLVSFDPDGETHVLEAIVFANSTISHDEARLRVASLTREQRDTLMSTYVGHRKNRRHRPGRAFERTDYRFELVTDYGAFRDLQRHRLLPSSGNHSRPTSASTCPT